MYELHVHPWWLLFLKRTPVSIRCWAMGPFEQECLLSERGLAVPLLLVEGVSRGIVPTPEWSVPSVQGLCSWFLTIACSPHPSDPKVWSVSGPSASPQVIGLLQSNSKLCPPRVSPGFEDAPKHFKGKLFHRTISKATSVPQLKVENSDSSQG